MNRTTMVAAAALAFIGLALFQLHLQRYERAVSGGPPARVLVTTLDVEAGERLTREVLAVRQVPEAFVEERHVRLGDLEAVLGVRAEHAIPRGVALRTSDVDPADGRLQALSGLLEREGRAVTLRTNAETFNSLVRRGDRVDVMLTADRPATRGATQQVTRLLVQDAKVLAVGDVVRAENETATGARSSFRDITLEVDIVDAGRLHHASQRGTIRLAIREPEDDTRLRELPMTDDDTLFDPLGADEG
ncbi:MAG: Flp pilus assembly protein CpaB [Myxococcota bacterium]